MAAVDMSIVEKLSRSLADKPHNAESRYAYGTAGFRARYNETMHQLFVRVGIIAAMRSLDCSGKCIGVMVTASHNLEEDNGVKIVDTNGGMLAKEWETLAEAMVNVSIAEFITSAIAKLETLSKGNCRPTVMIGQDTRPHSPALVACVREGVQALGGDVLELGEVITPALHFCVEAHNRAPPAEFSSAAALQHYFSELWHGYHDLLAAVDATPSSLQAENHAPLILDASNGVGSITVDGFLRFAEHASSAAQTSSGSTGLAGWKVEIRNRAGQGRVNEDCGAEHAQKLQRPPSGVDEHADANHLLCSFDGDGDRIVFHTFPSLSGGRWTLLDGDRIAALLASFLHTEIQAAHLENTLSLGVVQTAYANGASTAFFQSLQPPLPVIFAKTGVKHLHHAAQALDIGVYFEANGHGTVCFSPRARQVLLAGAPTSETQEGPDSRRQRLAYDRLCACLRVINQTVGDALSDLLAVLAILQVCKLDTTQWIAQYTELVSRQVKCQVADKSVLQCTEDEMRLVTPASLQEEIDRAVGRVPHGRCFLRPSGTEDVVRIYAEAETAEGVDELIAAATAALNAFFEKQKP